MKAQSKQELREELEKARQEIDSLKSDVKEEIKIRRQLEEETRKLQMPTYAETVDRLLSDMDDVLEYGHTTDWKMFSALQGLVTLIEYNLAKERELNNGKD